MDLCPSARGRIFQHEQQQHAAVPADGGKSLEGQLEVGQVRGYEIRMWYVCLGAPERRDLYVVLVRAATDTLPKEADT